MYKIWSTYRNNAISLINQSIGDSEPTIWHEDLKTKVIDTYDTRTSPSSAQVQLQSKNFSRGHGPLDRPIEALQINNRIKSRTIFIGIK